MSFVLRWGVISTGRIARIFAAALAASKTGKLAAIASRSLDKANAFASEFGAAHAFGSYEELLACADVDAVYIATPHPSHARWCVLAAEAKKHVLCEKPLGLNAGEVMAAQYAARKHDVFLMEAFMYRCHPQTARLVELIQSGSIGRVRAIAATFSFQRAFDRNARLYSPELGGGGLLDVGCYPVSFVRMVAGAALGRSVEPDEIKAVGVLNAETKVDEVVSAVLHFPGEIVAQISCGIAVVQESVVRIYGTEGWLELPAPWQPTFNGNPSEIVMRRGTSEERIRVECDKPLYAYEIDHVAQELASREGRYPAMNLADSLGNARALDRIRHEVGVTYPSESYDCPAPRLSGLPVAKKPGGAMRYGKVPGLELALSRLILGCDGPRDTTQAALLFDAFYEAGGNAFDTAWLYGLGRADQLLGHWIASRGLRSEVAIVAKGAHSPFCTPRFVNVHLRESLERLRTDYVDVFMLHRDNLDVPVSEFVDALNEHARAGRIRVIGVSNWTRQRVDEANAYAAKHSLLPFSVLSNQFSLARMVQAPWGGCLSCSEPDDRKWLEERKMPVLAWSSQARGFFNERAAEHGKNQELVRCWYSDDNLERRRRANELAEELGTTPINVAAAYVLAQAFPSFALVGCRTPDELDSSLATLGVTLTPEQVAWLDLR